MTYYIYYAHGGAECASEKELQERFRNLDGHTVEDGEILDLYNTICTAADASVSGTRKKPANLHLVTGFRGLDPHICIGQATLWLKPIKPSWRAKVTSQPIER